MSWFKKRRTIEMPEIEARRECPQKTCVTCFNQFPQSLNNQTECRFCLYRTTTINFMKKLEKRVQSLEEKIIPMKEKKK